MFGDTFYSFVLSIGDSKEFKFIFLNDNTLEYKHKAKEINKLIAWIDNEFADSDKYDGVFVTAHVSPFSKYYFNNVTEEFYRSKMAKSGVLLSLHGHDHDYFLSEFYHDSVVYLKGDDIGGRNHCVVTVYTRDNVMIDIKQEFF